MPPAVAAIVLKLLAKDPADRFQTPQELADALAPYASTNSFNRRSRRGRRAESAVPAAMAAEKTLGHGRDDTSPHICIPAAVRAEQEALSSWVETRLDDKRRMRRRVLWLAGATAGLAGAIATAALLWVQLG